MSMKTKDRWEIKRIVHAKYGGKCSYCGDDIDLRNFHVDHFEPKRRYRVILPDVHIERGTDHIDNLMPACATCNSCKSDLTLENFRERILDRLNRINNTSEYRIAKKYGLVQETGFDFVFFHFERVNCINNG